MTIAQNNSNEFEELCKKIIELLIGENSQIVKTKQRKDGGYDIYAKVEFEQYEYIIYFECKLRSNNLNLRDIAANVIIAYNNNISSFIAMSNYNFTPQLEENIVMFRKTSPINIKIIIGRDIKRIIKEYNLPINPELKGIISERKSQRKKIDSELLIDFSKDNVIQQLLFKKIEPEKIYNEHIFLKYFSHYISSIFSLIEAHKSIIVNGFCGVGKSLIINCAMNKFNGYKVHLNLASCGTKEQVMLNLLIKIWGLPGKKIIPVFDDNNLERIIESFNSYSKNIERVISSLLHYKSNNDRIDDNSLICEYISDMLAVHNNNNYLFYFENIQYANDEIFSFVSYLIKKLDRINIPCIIEYNDSEYYDKTISRNLIGLSNLNCYQKLKIKTTDKETAVNILIDYISISRNSAIQIVDTVGTRFYNYISVANYLKKKHQKLDYNLILHHLEMITPNDLPNITEKMIEYYAIDYLDFFCVMKIANSRVPIELCEYLNLPVKNIIEEGIAVVDNQMILAENQFIKKSINEMTFEPFHLNEMAKKIILFTSNYSEYTDLRINALFCLSDFKGALNLLQSLIKKLEFKHEYTLLLEYIDKSIVIYTQLNDYYNIAYYMIRKLEVLSIVKKVSKASSLGIINSIEAIIYSDCIDDEASDCFKIALCYFKGLIDLKSYNIKEIYFEEHKKYYKNCITRKNTNNWGDYLGKVCINYALFIKESKGNSEALKVFKESLRALPKSIELKREYLSHLACIKLSYDPNCAYRLYKQIIRLLDSDESFYGFPFHEYGDKAMCKVLLHDYNSALHHAELGIKYAESHGVVDEVGRILNIKGCAYLLDNNIEKALECFYEASELMDYTGYKHYNWRSKINYINYSITQKCNSTYKEMLDEAYNMFSTGLKNKINYMIMNDNESIFLNSREFHTLLVLGKCYMILNKNNVKCKSLIEISKDFNLDKSINAKFIKSVNYLLVGDHCKYINDLYYINRNVFLIG